jgi:response regulator RpfG family c-di-GMP phosphodiesterase
MQNILLVGHDSRLLSTRAAVLKKTKANVICCSASEALKLLESVPLDLIVLCHSLREEEAEIIAEMAHRCPQGPRVLLMILVAIQERPYRDANYDATSLPDPASLIARATELLHGFSRDPLRVIVSQPGIVSN